MNTDTAKAFLCLDGQNIEELRNKMETIGYNLQYEPNNLSLQQYIVFNGENKTFSFVAWLPELQCPERGLARLNCDHYANGDKNLAKQIFLELAKMNDSWDEGQWFYWLEGEGEPVKKKDNNPNWSWWCFEVRKATPLEVINYIVTNYTIIQYYT